MDFISETLTVLTEPTGFWETILNSFKSGVGSYIWAVILISVIVRLVMSVLDVFNRKFSMKSSEAMKRLQPEMVAIQKKYGNNKVQFQQKQSELMKRNGVSMAGACLPMLVMMILQMVVFLTLFNSLQSLSTYNIVKRYETMKNIYQNVVLLNENDDVKNAIISAGDNCELKVDVENKKLKIYVNDASYEVEMTDLKKNNELYNNVLLKYVVKNDENTAYVDTTINEKVKILAQETIAKYYKDSQESFLWVKNVYKSDTSTSPLFTYSEIVAGLKKCGVNYNDKNADVTANEKEIFNCVVTSSINEKSLGTNGYYLLTIFAVLISALSIWLTNRLMNGKSSQNATPRTGKFMYILMPILFGFFTLMYTSLFAIYIIVGQIVMVAIMPLTIYIVKKWIKHDELKKQETSVVDVDYRRKDQNIVLEEPQPQKTRKSRVVKSEYADIDYRRSVFIKNFDEKQNKKKKNKKGE